MQFGISTYLFRDERLTRDHLAAIAGHGFAAIELYAARAHVDYHDAAAIDAVAGWLESTGLALHSVHAPISDGPDATAGPPISTASPDEPRRLRAIREAERALAVARRIPCRYLVAHVGVPDAPGSSSDGSRDAARRSVGELHRLASSAGVRLALELIPNRLSSVAALQHLIDEELELPDVGICLDLGHAFLADDVVDAIEAASGHLVTAHVHDNGGRTDEHLVPFEGRIDWPGALFALQKVGYEGLLVLELAGGGVADVLARAQAACRRFEDILAN